MPRVVPVQRAGCCWSCREAGLGEPGASPGVYFLLRKEPARLLMSSLMLPVGSAPSTGWEPGSEQALPARGRPRSPAGAGTVLAAADQPGAPLHGTSPSVPAVTPRPACPQGEPRVF